MALVTLIPWALFVLATIRRIISLIATPSPTKEALVHIPANQEHSAARAADEARRNAVLDAIQRVKEAQLFGDEDEDDILDLDGEGAEDDPAPRMPNCEVAP